MVSSKSSLKYPTHVQNMHNMNLEHVSKYHNVKINKAKQIG
jgi:hypothetical protein